MRTWVAFVVVLGAALPAARAGSITDSIDFSPGNEPSYTVTLTGWVAPTGTPLGLPIDGNSSTVSGTIPDPAGQQLTLAVSDALAAHDGTELDGGHILGSAKPEDGWDLSYDATLTYGGADPMTWSLDATVTVSAEGITLDGQGYGSYGAHGGGTADLTFSTTGSGVVGTVSFPDLDMSAVPQNLQQVVAGATTMEVKLIENGITTVWIDLVGETNLLAPGDPVPTSYDLLGGASYQLLALYAMEVPYPVDPTLPFSLAFTFSGVEVPEPGGLGLLALAALGLALGRRRRG